MWRLKLVQLGVILWFLIVLALLARIQIIGIEEYKELAEKQSLRIIKRPPFRGGIYDRNHRPLALSIPVLDLYQRVVKDSVKDATGLLKKLGIEPLDIKPGQWRLLKKNVPIEYKPLVMSRKLKGISAIKTYQRIYPFDQVARNVVGFASRDRGQGLVGKEGLEKTLEEFIGGKSGYEYFLQSAVGERFYVATRKEPVPGENVRTTLDMIIQTVAFHAVKNKVIEENANWGFVIVVDPQTGEVMAMAQYRNPSKKGRGYVNYGVQYQYEPGSTIKIFTLAKALEMGLVNEDDSIFVPKGGLKIGRYTIRNVTDEKGYITWRYALAHSVNTAFAKLGLKIGADSLYAIFRRVGFGLKTDILLNGETNGRLIKRKRKIEIANWAMGQGLSVSGIQMAMAYSCIANGGWLLAPRLLLQIGETPYDDRVIVRRCMDDSTASRLKELLTVVVDSGSGRLARIPGMEVAGKTGTAQKFDPQTGAYSTVKVVTSFIGFFPADSPRYLIYVVVDEPQKNKYGGTVAAPVFKEIALQIINYDRILHPDNPLKLKIHENLDSQ